MCVGRLHFVDKSELLLLCRAHVVATAMSTDDCPNCSEMRTEMSTFHEFVHNGFTQMWRRFDSTDKTLAWIVDELQKLNAPDGNHSCFKNFDYVHLKRF